ncbi:MAG: hypothetical protein ACRD8O_13775, partial [Bryobacteraceae bacterium]
GVTGIFNIASAQPVSMKTLAELVVRAAPGCQSQVRPSGEPDTQEGATALVSIDKAARMLGWKPRTSLEDGIAACVRARLGA